MKKKTAIIFTALLASLALAVCVPLTYSGSAYAAEARTAAHIEQYRPQLSYTPNTHWNNDPNGLLYVPSPDGEGGTYHMYYQYGNVNNRWSDMHWGHATSTDLVHWQEHEIAIRPNGDASGGKPTGPIFSGSAVYVSADRPERGYNGAGVYAIFTQPNQQPEEGVGDQRQSIAYSADGETFAADTFREIIENNFDGVSRGDFRDPKVSWNEKIGKWMMVVGGGEILQFTSEDLSEWEYLGTTGMWGECPDLFPIAAPDSLSAAYGDEIWVLVMSPEDKEQSHAYNGTDRSTHEYPNEYYALGSLDSEGHFVPFEGETLHKLSLGIDCYAIQTFNDVPGGRRIGVSWSASWKTVNDYALDDAGGLRENWNGGLTMIYELGIKDEGGKPVLTRVPVSEYEQLRKESALYENEDATIGKDNILEGKHASLAELDLTLDVSATTATKVVLGLASSAYEHTDIIYDIVGEKLTVDRSAGSLAAKNTARWSVPFAADLAPTDGKVRIRAWLDWGNLFVSAGAGEVSGNVAIFPSLYSDGLTLTADADVKASVKVYRLDGIWDNGDAAAAFDDFYISAKEENIYVGDELTVLACTPDPDFDLGGSEVSVSGDAVSAEKRADGSVKVTALAVGDATVTLSCGGKEKRAVVHVLSGTVSSDENFSTVYAGSWKRDNGYIGSSGEDGFVYGDEKHTNFRLTATVTSVADGSVAFGIMFAAGDTYHTYYCANYDYGAQEVKLWMSGGSTVAEYPLALRRGEPVTYELTAKNGDVTIVVNGEKTVSASVGDTSGYIGLNVYNGSFRFNDVRVYGVYTAGEPVAEKVGDEAFMLRNETASRYLTADDYTVTDGVLTLAPAYVSTLPGGKTQEFTLTLASGVRRYFTVDVYSAVQIYDSYFVLGDGDDLALSLSTGTASVTGVLIDGKPVEFGFSDMNLSVSAAVIGALAEGDHTLTVVASSGGAANFVFGYRIVPPPPADIRGKVIGIVAISLLGIILVGFTVLWIAKRSPRR